MLKKILVLITALVILCSLTLTACSTKTTTTSTSRTITDLIGRNVQIPGTVNRLAALVGPSYDKVFMLGGKDKIAMIGFAQSPWAALMNPDIKNYQVASNAQTPNIEELLKQNVEVVFTWDTPAPLQTMANAGIPALAALASSASPTTAEAYITAMKKEVNLYADVLGKEAQDRAAKYNKYLDDVVKRVTSVTTKIADKDKPKVYYIRGPQILTTHGKYSNTRWYVEMAGGNLVSKDMEQLIPTVNIEQVIIWDPDIIMMGRLNTTQPVVSDPAWSAITAVKTQKVYVNPYGDFYWDYGAEGALFLLYLAKTFRPDLFKDVDMVKEVKKFYADFYNFKLTDDQANKILLQQNP